MFEGIKGLFSNDIGIDLGTPIRWFFERRVLSCASPPWSPSSPAPKTSSPWQRSQGCSARTAQHRSHPPHERRRHCRFRCHRGHAPLFHQKVHHRKLVQPRVVVAVPSGITEVERRAVEDSVTRAGASEFYPIKQPSPPPLGPGCPWPNQPEHGRGYRRRHAEIAVISLANIVQATSLRVGGDQFDSAIINHMKRA